MKQRLIRKAKLMASSIYNILKKMYTEIQSEVTQSDFNQDAFNARNYKVMDVMDLTVKNQNQGNMNQRNNTAMNSTQRYNATSNNTQRSNTPSSNSQHSNTPSSNCKKEDYKTSDNLRNYNQADNYSGDNLGLSNPTPIISVSDEKQKELVRKLQQAVIMAEVLSQPVCRTRGYKRNKINR